MLFKAKIQQEQINMRYKDKRKLEIFLGLLIACELIFLANEIAKLGAAAFRTAFALLLFAMVYDMIILSGAWKSRDYILHHGIAALFCVAGMLSTGFITGIGCGYFVCYTLIGATVKRIRLLRNWERIHRDKPDKFLKQLYNLIGKIDFIVFIPYIIFFAVSKVNLTTNGIISLFFVCLIVILLLVRFALD